MKQFPKLTELRRLAGQAGDNELVRWKELSELKRLHIHLLCRINMGNGVIVGPKEK